MIPYGALDAYQLGALLAALEYGAITVSAVLIVGLVLYAAMVLEQARAALHRSRVAEKEAVM